MFLVFGFVLLAAVGCRGRIDPGTVPDPAAAARTETSPSEGERLPLDPAVLHGTLSNGMQYFIRANHKPENRAELRLAVNAGSVLEDDDQQGLAHFVEHMAFNGTKHFKKQELVDYLESIGMRFGADLNAYTNMDETVYMLEVPTDDETMLEKGFQILEDWAHLVSFDDNEIEKERGVVIEEWRLGRGARARINDKQFPLIFQGSRYADRLTIGKKEILEHCTHDTLRRFYRDWYRPDLMAVIAVGDFDPEAVEKQVVERFGNIPSRKEERKRPVFPVPDHKGIRVSIETDPEMTSTSGNLLFKRELEPQGTEDDYRRNLVESLYHGMLNERLNELTRKSDPPFLYAWSGGGRWVRSKGIYSIGVGVEDGGLKRGLAAAAREAERVRRFGFTDTELERRKSETLRSMEQSWNERDKLPSRGFAAEYVRVFLQEESAPGLEKEYRLAEKFLPGISLENVNALAGQWMTDDNRVLLASGPEKKDAPLPSEQELLDVLDGVKNADLEPYKDEVREEPLVTEAPEPGTVVEEHRIDPIDTTYWTLSNGVRVILKPTDYKNDEVVMSAYRYGGNSLVGEDRYVSALLATDLVGAGGAGEFSAVELEKKLAGKIAQVGTGIGTLTETMRGGASRQDLDTLFRLIWLRFTAPRRDEEAVNALMQQYRGFLANQENDPNAVFSNRWTEIVGQGHYRMRPFTVDTLDQVDLDTALEVYKERFAAASGFTFVFVGNFDLGGIRPLVEQWLGGLPAGQGGETWKDPEVPVLTGVHRFQVKKGVEPKSAVRIRFDGAAEWSPESDHLLRSMTSLLSVRLRKVLREDMGGVYGVGAYGSISRIPRERYNIQIRFGCDPERVQELLAAVYGEIEKLKNQPPEEEEVAAVREKQVRARETSLMENGFWLSRLQSYDMDGRDPRKILEFGDLVEQVTPESMQAAARKYFTLENLVEGILVPE